MEYWQILREKLGNQLLILPSAVGAVLMDGKILLAKRHHSHQWHIPGGVQDLHESITDTIEREIYEEFRLEMKVDKLISVLSSPKWTQTLPNGHEMQPLTLFFLMKGKVDPARIKVQTEEIALYDFFPLDDLPSDLEECCMQKCMHLAEYDGTVRFC